MTVGQRMAFAVDTRHLCIISPRASHMPPPPPTPLPPLSPSSTVIYKEKRPGKTQSFLACFAALRELPREWSCMGGEWREQREIRLSISPPGRLWSMSPFVLFSDRMCSRVPRRAPARRPGLHHLSLGQDEVERPVCCARQSEGGVEWRKEIG